MSGRLFRIEDWEQLAKTAGFKPGETAALCGVSNRQLERFFQENFKMPPRIWMRQLQCRLAKDLISKGYSNKAIVADLRFSSQAHFCREFKKQFGASPQSFGPIWTSHSRNVASG
jgi:AraC-like DNA-binding protein